MCSGWACDAVLFRRIIKGLQQSISILMLAFLSTHLQIHPYGKTVYARMQRCSSANSQKFIFPMVRKIIPLNFQNYSGHTVHSMHQRRRRMLPSCNSNPVHKAHTKCAGQMSSDQPYAQWNHFNPSQSISAHPLSSVWRFLNSVSRVPQALPRTAPHHSLATLESVPRPIHHSLFPLHLPTKLPKRRKLILFSVTCKRHTNGDERAKHVATAPTVLAE